MKTLFWALDSQGTGGAATAARHRHAEATHAALRSPRSLAIILAAAALFLGLMLQFETPLAGIRVPAVAVVGGFMLLSALSAAAHARRGFRSRLYLALNAMESAVAVLGSLFLVYRSGSAFSFYWFIFLVVSVQTGSFGFNIRFNVLLFTAGPAGLALAFLLGGDPRSAALTIGLGGVAFAAWLTTLKTTLGMAEGMAAREALEQQERDLLVLRERERISRDLHDGLSAELTGLLYRLQEPVDAAQGNPAASAEREELADRLRDSIDELRNVVWVLRAEAQTVADLANWLQRRCRDLCPPEVAFALSVEGDATQPLAGEVRMHLARAVLEAVRNAVRHSGARSIEVTLDARGAPVVTVADDGCGLAPDALERTQGGLANLRARSEELGGRLTFTATPGSGTTVRLEAAGFSPASQS